MNTFASNIKHVGSQVASNPFDRSIIHVGNYVPPNPLNRGAPIPVIRNDRPPPTHAVVDRTGVSAWLNLIEHPNESMRANRKPDSVNVARQVSEQQHMGAASGHDPWLIFHHLSTVMGSGDNVGSTGKSPI